MIVDEAVAAAAPTGMSGDQQRATIQRALRELMAAPLTSDFLAGLQEDECRSLLGERLYPLVSVVEPNLAGKITGMLIELEICEVLELPRQTRTLGSTITTQERSTAPATLTCIPPSSALLRYLARSSCCVSLATTPWSSL